MPEDTLKDAIEATRKAAVELASASVRLTKRVLDKADAAAQDPSGSVKKVAQRAAKELDSAAKEIDRLLQKL
jgi:hypothetical protein